MKNWKDTQGKVYCIQYTDPKGKYSAPPFQPYHCPSCGQMYHLNCIMDWLMHESYCLVCNQDIPL